MEMEMEDSQPKMGVRSWIGTIVLSIIPGVNIVCWILWLFGVGNKNRCNYIRAGLIFTIIIAAILVGTYFILTKAVGMDLQTMLVNWITEKMTAIAG